MHGYHDPNIVQFLSYGWPIDYTAGTLPETSLSNHPSAISFSEHVDYYIATELEHGTIAGPFLHNLLPRPLISSPLQTVPKRGSTKCRVIMDLSFPPSHSVNSGVQTIHTSMNNTSYDFQALTDLVNLFCNTAVVVYCLFQSLKDLLHELGVQTSPHKDCPPSTNMVFLGVEVDLEHFTLSVTATNVQDLLTELVFWSSREFYTLIKAVEVYQKTYFHGRLCQSGSHLYVPLIE